MQLFGLFAHLCQSDELPLLPPPLVSTPPTSACQSLRWGIFIAFTRQASAPNYPESTGALVPDFKTGRARSLCTN